LHRIEEIIRQARRNELGDPFPKEDGTPELDTQTKAVIHRIAIANAYRQQQFMFWRRREYDRRHAVSYEVNTQIVRNPQPIESSQKLPSAAQDDTRFLNSGKPALSQVPSATWNMPKALNLALLNETRSLSSNTEITETPTVYDPSGSRVGWPTFPKDLGGKKDFICPYCFTTCPAKYRRKTHWR
jgi:hypothetical protein